MYQGLSDKLSRDSMPIHNDGIFRRPVVCDVLRYALYDKGHGFVLLRSNVQERSTMLGEASWILGTAHSTVDSEAFVFSGTQKLCIMSGL